MKSSPLLKKEKPYPTYVCQYCFGGATWIIHIQAKNDAEAEDRAKTLGQLQICGKLRGSFPADSN